MRQKMAKTCYSHACACFATATSIFCKEHGEAIAIILQEVRYKQNHPFALKIHHNPTYFQQTLVDGEVKLIQCQDVWRKEWKGVEICAKFTTICIKMIHHRH